MLKWYPVKVWFDDFIHYDEIQGENEENALKNARWNWESVIKIELIKEGD